MKAALLWVKFEKTAENCLQLSNILTNFVKHLIANPAIYTANSYKYHFVKSSRLIQRPYTNLNFVLDIFMTGKKYDYDNEQLRCKKDEFKALTDKCSVSELDNLSIDGYYNNSDVGALCIILISDLRQLNGVIFSIASSRFAVLQSKKYQDDLVKTIIKDDE